MDLRHLRSFAAVARTGSFTAAATELGFTQSAVSQHVAALEKDLGRPLLTRRPVGLTADGERLAGHARQILLRVDVARTEVGPRDAPPGRLRLACTPLSLCGRIAAALARLRADEPRLHVSIATTTRDGALRAVASADADAALLDGVTTPNAPLAAAEPGTLARSFVAASPLVVLLPTGHPLAGCADLSLDAVRDAAWVDAPALGCDPSVVPGAAPPAAAVRLRYEGVDVAAVTRLVGAGLGLALLPADVVRAAHDVAAVPVRDAVLHRVELLSVPGRPDAVAPLVAALAA